MLAFSDWFPLATAGLTFTILGKGQIDKAASGKISHRIL